MLNHIKMSLRIITLTLSFFLVSNVLADSNPVNMLQSIANNMIAGLKANQATLKTKPQIVYNLAYKYVVPHADLTEMSKRVLPPKVWNSASAMERQQFQKQFTTLLIRTYATALSSYKDQTIEFFPMRNSNGDMTEVTSQIKSTTRNPIKVTYRLIRRDGDWKLYDMSVEGVSLIASFRSQFANILAHSNINQLTQTLSGHNLSSR